VSNLETSAPEVLCDPAPAQGPVVELLPGREVVLGTRDGTMVTRTLPNKDRRMVGAWCFADLYGPTDITGQPGMRVAPHPHAGLQTVSWLSAGEVLHRDSLGNLQTVQPGQLNLMTAGRGISHSEESPAGHSPALHGVQLWTALPAQDRDTEPAFEHHAVLPGFGHDGWQVTVVMGQLGGTVSPATAFTPLVLAELRGGPGTLRLPVDPAFEHALFTLSGRGEAYGVPAESLYLGAQRDELELTAQEESRFLLLGGVPFTGQIVMWWNFVGRGHDDIVAMRDEWMEGDRFGVVHGYDGARLPAPPLPGTTLKPRGRTR
jgi:redox-sensitive bicupin YhaK (pirin superfamily)